MKTFPSNEVIDVSNGICKSKRFSEQGYKISLSKSVNMKATEMPFELMYFRRKERKRLL